MIVSVKLLGVNPFVQAFTESDLLGKAIFVALILLSVITWIVLLYKVRLMQKARRYSERFQEEFEAHRHNPLNFSSGICEKTESNPFLSLYLKLKGYTVDLLNKNRCFGNKGETAASSYLSPADIDLVGAHLSTVISSEAKGLERNLYILSTAASLAPFLGLLGTVWGILATFSQPQLLGTGGSHAILGGISLALVTTVLGLLNAIPALIGYNYLKDSVSDFETSMEEFSSDVLSSVELQYRQVDLK